MKKVLTILCAGLILLSCANYGKHAINSKELQGKYEIDFSSLLSNMNDGPDENSLASALASMIFSSMEMTVQFDGDKLIIDASGFTRNFINIFGGDNVNMPLFVDYKIKNDSVLYAGESADALKEIGVLRKIGTSYDYLQLVCSDDGQEKVLTMRRKAE